MLSRFCGRRWKGRPSSRTKQAKNGGRGQDGDREHEERKVGKSTGVFARGYKPPSTGRTTARHTQTHPDTPRRLAAGRRAGESDCALPSRGRRGRRGRRGLFVRRRDDYSPAHYGQVVIHRYEYIYTSRCVDVYLDSIHICICIYVYQSLF